MSASTENEFAYISAWGEWNIEACGRKAGELKRLVQSAGPFDPLNARIREEGERVEKKMRENFGGGLGVRGF